MVATNAGPNERFERAARAPSIPHVGALDGARGVAVAGVVLFHGGHLVGGYLGVDFFFTLSGFLITSLLLAEAAERGRVDLGHFWARRARRLLPALALLMAGVAAYAALLADRGQLGQIRGDALATLAYVANWHAIGAGQSYFALFAAPSPLTHTWSLAIEEQFYVVWPLVFVAIAGRFSKARARAVLVTALVLAAGSTASMIGLYDALNPSRVYYGTDTRATAILLGAALAAWLALHPPRLDRRRRAALEIVGLLGVATLAVAWSRLDGQSATLYRGGFAVCGIAAAAVIAAAVHPRRGPIAAGLGWAPLRGLGLISYGVYLYHWPIDVVLDEQRMGFGGWSLLGFQAAITVAIAYASYRIVEQPIRRGALSASQLRRLTPVVAIGLVGAIVVATNAADGAPRQITHPVAAAAAAYRAAPRGSTRVMVVGDSVGYFLARAMAKMQTRPPTTTLNTAVLGCAFPPQLPMTGVEQAPGGLAWRHPPPCGPSWEVNAMREFKPDVVIWIWADFAGDLIARDSRLAPCSKPFDSAFRAALEQEVARLRGSGARVVLTTEADNRARYTTVTDAMTRCENAIVRSVAARSGAQLADLFAYVCPGGACRTKVAGTVLREDGLHYEGAGADLVARWILDRIPR